MGPGTVGVRAPAAMRRRHALRLGANTVTLSSAYLKRSVFGSVHNYGDLEAPASDLHVVRPLKSAISLLGGSLRPVSGQGSRCARPLKSRLVLNIHTEYITYICNHIPTA